MREQDHDTEDRLQDQIDANLMRAYRQPCEAQLPDALQQLLQKLRDKEAARG